MLLLHSHFLQYPGVHFSNESRNSVATITPHFFTAFSNQYFLSVNANLRSRRCHALVFSDSCNIVRGEPFRDNYNILDHILSCVEVVCLASSAIIPLSFAMNRESPLFLGVEGTLALQLIAMVSTVTIGVFIRRLQWKRIHRSSVQNSGVYGSTFSERIQNLEEDSGRATIIIRALSRHVEKLGIRFRVARKSFKGSISETTALAQKNSEVTQTLAEQGRNLEKEIVEIQGILLEMQEQQQKQLDLIVEMGKSRKDISENKSGDVESPTTTMTEVNMKETSDDQEQRHTM